MPLIRISIPPREPEPGEPGGPREGPRTIVDGDREAGRVTALVLRGIACAMLLLQLYTALAVTGILPGYDGSFYLFTVPHLLVLIASVAAMALAAFVHEPEIHWASVGAPALLLPTHLAAIAQWPGGDDGPGMAWLVGIGALSAANTVIGIVLALIAWRIEKRRQAILDAEADL